jgi:hypothetical protein
MGLLVQPPRPPALAEVGGYATTAIVIANAMLMCMP